jgi:ParB family transcriptional regulator, chromosome partitioning protein
MADARQIPVARLREAPWNANRVPAAILRRIRRSLLEFGIVENLVARPHPCERQAFEVISGNHRLRLFVELGVEAVPVVVLELDDARARLLVQTLNRTRGTDDPVACAQLLERILLEFEPARVAEFLPESEATIDRLLHA